ncbi:MAG: DUF2490 domain-containing protein [Pseudomonadota bacterium]
MKNLILKVITAMLPLILPVKTLAGDNDFQGWSQIAVNGSATKDSRFLLWFDGHARYGDDSSRLATSIVRPGIGWKATNKLNLWLGYARVRNPVEGLDIKEDRIWQQATYPIVSIFGGKLTGRTRLEQRTRDDFGDDTGNRIRHMFHWSKSISDGPYSLIFANEYFFNADDTDWGQRSGFDQNRAYAAIGWQAAENTRIEFGYLHNNINSAGSSNRTNNVFSLGLFHKL